MRSPRASRTATRSLAASVVVTLLGAVVVLGTGAGCSSVSSAVSKVFRGDVSDTISADEEEWYAERVELEARIEKLEDELERAELKIDAARDELYPRFVRAIRPYFEEKWAEAVDALADLLVDYPESEVTDLARRLLEDARERQAMTDLLCSEDWRLFPSRLEPLDDLERAGVAAAFLKQCPAYEDRVRALLDRLRRSAAIRDRYSGEGERRETVRGRDVDLEEGRESTSEEALGVEEGKEIDLDAVTTR